MDKIKIGVITTSDRASQGIYEDISGVAIMDTMKEYLLNECEYAGYIMKRAYINFYHFAGAATRSTPEQSTESTRKEIEAHEFFATKWGEQAKHNTETNSKLLSKFK